MSCPQREDEEMESEEDDDNQSVSSVNVSNLFKANPSFIFQSNLYFQIDSDPLHIHISPSVFDNNFVNFLQTHPITKEFVCC